MVKSRRLEQRPALALCVDCPIDVLEVGVGIALPVLSLSTVRICLTVTDPLNINKFQTLVKNIPFSS